MVGDQFIFAGVWDGHGGDMSSDYVQSHIFPNFQTAVMNVSNEHKYHPAFSNTSSVVAEAFKIAYKQTDKDYIKYSKSLKIPTAQFAGTCAVACYIDVDTGKVTCGNLGDSRAVMGTYEPKRRRRRSSSAASDDAHADNYYLRTTPLSIDHGADNMDEQKRILALHPHDKTVLTDMNEYPDEEPDWRVKKICAFTRSIGDCQLKDKGCAALFNSYVPHQQRILPRPGVPVKVPNSSSKHREERITPPYISNVPEIKEASVKDKDGFIIIGKFLFTVYISESLSLFLPPHAKR